MDKQGNFIKTKPMMPIKEEYDLTNQKKFNVHSKAQKIRAQYVYERSKSKPKTKGRSKTPDKSRSNNKVAYTNSNYLNNKDKPKPKFIYRSIADRKAETQKLSYVEQNYLKKKYYGKAAIKERKEGYKLKNKSKSRPKNTISKPYYLDTSKFPKAPKDSKPLDVNYDKMPENIATVVKEIQSVNGVEIEEDKKMWDLVNSQPTEIESCFEPVGYLMNVASLINDTVYADDVPFKKKEIENQRISISDTIAIDKVAEMKEEPDSDDDDYHGEPENWSITTFIPSTKSNQFTDISDLRNKGEGYEAALEARGDANFQDPEFPANDMAIMGFLDDLPDRYRGLEWKRPDEFNKRGKSDEPCILFDTIECSDIRQGSLGDCYFLAAVSSIAQKHDRLARLILDKERDDTGLYQIALCIGGIWEPVLLDDYFPCNPETGYPKFTHSKTNELWVMFLEKGWAKVHGGYLNIKRGLAREALRYLTGASCKTFFPSTMDMSELWGRLRNYTIKEFPCTACSKNLNNGSDNFMQDIGISGSHAYSLLGAYELIDEDGVIRTVSNEESESIEDKSTLIRLVKLRNPWGRGEWKGEWSDQDERWTPELLEELGVTGTDDGIFFMAVDAFLEYFNDFQVCKYYDDYSYSAIRVVNELKTKPVYLSFDISTAGKYYFSINQYTKRFYPSSKKYRYSNISFLIVKQNEDGGMEFVGSRIKSDSESWFSYQAEPGKYFVYIKTPWRSIINEFSFSVYGPSEMEVKQIELADLPPRCFELAFMNEAQKDETTKRTVVKSTGLKFHIKNNQNGFGWVHLTNENEEKAVRVSVNISNSKKVKLLNPYFGNFPYVIVEPDSDMVLVYEGVNIPYSARVKVCSSFIYNKEKLTSMALDKGVKTQKKNGEDDVEIYMYVYKHKNGMVLYYENNEEKLSLNEEISFGLTGCFVSGVFGNTVEVVVEPNTTEMISVVRKKGETEFDVKINDIRNRLIEYY